MAITNHDRVGKALELLKGGLGPFVEREVKAHFGESWDAEMRETLSDTRLGGAKGEPLQDVAAMLELMWEAWNDVFRKILGPPSGASSASSATSATAGRTRRPFSGDDAYRALDSIARLLTAISAPAGRRGRAR